MTMEPIEPSEAEVEAAVQAMLENDSAQVGSKLYEIHELEFRESYTDSAIVALRAAAKVRAQQEQG